MLARSEPGPNQRQLPNGIANFPAGNPWASHQVDTALAPGACEVGDIVHLGPATAASASVMSVNKLYSLAWVWDNSGTLTLSIYLADPAGTPFNFTGADLRWVIQPSN
jgi:hypothetical protein